MLKRRSSHNYQKELRRKINEIRKAGKLPQDWSIITATELNRLAKYQTDPITPDKVVQVANDRFGNDDILNKLLELSVRSNIPAKIELCNMILGIKPQAS